MPDTKLSALPAGSAVANADLFYSVQSGASVKQTALALQTFMSGGMSIGAAVTGGTPGSVLFVGTGPVLAQDNAKFNWNDSSGILLAGSELNLLVNSVSTPAAYCIYQPTASGGNNWFFGEAGNLTVTGGGNVGIGGASQFRNQALNVLSSGSSNTAIGAGALSKATTGYNNVAIGLNAMADLVSGNNNVGIGQAAGLTVNGTNNVALGTNALANNTTGNNNMAIGTGAFASLASSDGNVAVGVNAGNNMSGGFGNNTFIGNNAGNSVTIGHYCTLIGNWLGFSSLNQAIAFSTGTGNPPQLSYNILNSTGWVFHNLTSPQSLYVYNTLDSFSAPTNWERAIFDWNVTSNVLTIGTQKGGTGVLRDVRVVGGLGGVAANLMFGVYQPTASGGNNWFFGEAGNTSVSGGGNVGIGGATQYRNQAMNVLSSGNYNMAIGGSALSKLTTGSNNVAIGARALDDTISGNDNVGLGYLAAGATTGNQNVAIGSYALANNTTGSNNTAIGVTALVNSNSDGNVGIGTNAGINLSSGGSNVFIGTNSANAISTSSYSTVIGGWIATGFSTFSKALAFSDGTGSNPPYLSWGILNYTGWTFHNLTSPQSLYVYNTLDSFSAPTNWECGLLDWNVTSNVFRLSTQKGGTGTVRLIAIDGFQKAGAPAAADLPSTTCALINDTSGGQTWLVYNNAGTIRKVQLT
jgi:hypothetical protein